MIIHSYVITCPDEVDVLPDCLNSLSEVSDHIFIADGGLGGGSLIHCARYTRPIAEWILNQSQFGRDCCPGTEHWRQTPITIMANLFKDPAHQRNWILQKMNEHPEQPDWIIWIDSDEVASWELIRGIRPRLESLSQDVEGVYLKWLTLVQDEQHCVEHTSNWLAHPRIHRPTTGRFQGSWHEHMLIDRSWCVQWDVRVIHTRALFTERLRVQRGHDAIASGNTPLWADAKMIDVPRGVTWPTLHWPDGERETPFR